MGSTSASESAFEKVLVIVPNWVGDVVLATPALRAIREQLPQSEITYLMRPYVADVLHNAPWMDRVVLWQTGGRWSRSQLLRTAKNLRNQGYGWAILFPNSFRSGLLAWLIGARRRIGYARDYRSWLLTDRLSPTRDNGQFRIESMLTYYERLARQVGCPGTSGHLELHTDEASDREVARWWDEFKISPEQPVVLLNPGAAFGSSKLYPADSFAQVGTALARDPGARILITAGPKELAIAESVRERMEAPAIVVAPPRLSLRKLKSLVARSQLLITNDTGPRHFAIAFDVPVVTIFGPTHPGWTETHYPREQKVFIPVDCGPCQKPTCPLDHRCMTGIEPPRIVTAAKELLAANAEV